MALTVSVTPGYVFAPAEALDLDKLNQLGRPTFALAGTIDTAELAAGAVTSDKATPGPWFWGGTSVYDAGTATYAVTLPIAPTSLAAGLELYWQVDTANPTACKLNVNSLGAVALTKRNNAPLTIGDLLVNQIVGVRYDATAGAWQLLTPPARPEYETILTDTGVADAYAIAPAPAYTSYAEATGRTMGFKVAHANASDAPTLALNGLGTPPTIVKHGNRDLDPGDLRANSIAQVCYDGANWQLLNPNVLDRITGAYVKFAGRGTNGDATLYKTSNVTKVERTGAGLYTVTFVAPFTANYCGVITCSAPAGGASIAVGNLGTQNTTDAAMFISRIAAGTFAAYDPDYCHAVFFGSLA